jgi:type VI secretion system protein ImpA
MATERLLTDDLLDPISPQEPAGANLRWLPEWDRIKEARQSEDGLQAGKWAKKDPKSANWPLALELATAMLRERSKDLQLAMWLTEASLKLHAFAGLRDGLRVARELMARFWDAGLYPLIEDGPEDRGGPFEWLNEKVVDSVLSIPITRRETGGEDYSLTDLRDARLVGSEKQLEGSDGDIDAQKKREFERALAAGRVSLDMFKTAVRETRRAAYEELFTDFEEASEEFKALERSIDERFGEAAPNLAAFRNALNDIRLEMTTIRDEKRREEPDAPASQTMEAGANSADAGMVRLPLSHLSAAGVRASGSESWAEAERLVRAGIVDAGLSEMRRLAASETTGRSRFERKLLLAEVCLASQRERLAKTVLEELAEQIDKHQLESWESSELISGVWTRLYELYKRGSEADEAAKLYGRLCRLDPWQALACSE